MSIRYVVNFLGILLLSSAASFITVSGKENLIDVKDQEDKEKYDNNDHKNGDEESEAEENFIETDIPSLKPSCWTLNSAKQI